jgi:hypothetical protein
VDGPVGAVRLRIGTEPDRGGGADNIGGGEDIGRVDGRVAPHPADVDLEQDAVDDEAAHAADLQHGPAGLQAVLKAVAVGVQGLALCGRLDAAEGWVAEVVVVDNAAAEDLLDGRGVAWESGDCERGRNDCG